MAQSAGQRAAFPDDRRHQPRRRRGPDRRAASPRTTRWPRSECYCPTSSICGAGMLDAHAAVAPRWAACLSPRRSASGRVRSGPAFRRQLASWLTCYPAPPSSDCVGQLLPAAGNFTIELTTTDAWRRLHDQHDRGRGRRRDDHAAGLLVWRWWRRRSWRGLVVAPAGRGARAGRGGAPSHASRCASQRIASGPFFAHALNACPEGSSRSATRRAAIAASTLPTR